MVTLDPIQLKKWQEDNAEGKRYDYEAKAGESCLDIGSYKREWGKIMSDRYDVVVEYFDALDNRAAWTHDGVLMFGGQYYYSSAFEPEGPQTCYKCVDIAPYLQREIAVCKVNIEGGEYDLLEYIIRKGLHKNIKYLQVQFHIVEGMDWEERYKWIAETLSATHTLQWRYPFVWESWQRK